MKDNWFGSQFIYYGKTKDGKQYPLANAKIFDVDFFAICKPAF